MKSATKGGECRKQKMLPTGRPVCACRVLIFFHFYTSTQPSSPTPSSGHDCQHYDLHTSSVWAMPRFSKALPGPSKLSVVLANLNKQPRAALPSLKSLAITFASRNDHFGARYVWSLWDLLSSFRLYWMIVIDTSSRKTFLGYGLPTQSYLSK